MTENVGDIGEDEFRLWCSKAGLDVTSPNRDKGGWDFLVFFGHDSTGNDTLDRRPSPPFFFVQVKTTRGKNHSTRLKLSSLEKLAKYPAPSFVILLVQNDSREITNAYLIHLRGKRLEHVLRRLRELDANGQQDELANKILRFTPDDSEEIAPTPEGLKEALIKSIAGSFKNYLASKSSELETMGYVPEQGLVRATLTGSSIEEIENAFLGIVPAKISEFKQEDTRFNVKISSDHQNASSLMMMPMANAKCLLRIDWEDLSYPLVQRMSLITASVVKNRIAIRVFDQFLSLVMRPDDEGIHYYFYITSDKKPWTLEKWSSHWTLVAALTSGKAVVTICPPPNLPGPTLSIPFTTLYDKANQDSRNNLYKAKALDLVAIYAGFDPEATFGYDIFLSQSIDTSILEQLLLLKAWIPASALSVEDLPIEGSLCLVHGSINLNQMTFSWAGITIFSHQRDEGKGLFDFRFAGARRTDNSASFDDDFIKKILSTHKIDTRHVLNADKLKEHLETRNE